MEKEFVFIATVLPHPLMVGGGGLSGRLGLQSDRSSVGQRPSLYINSIN